MEWIRQQRKSFFTQASHFYQQVWKIVQEHCSLTDRNINAKPWHWNFLFISIQQIVTIAQQLSFVLFYFITLMFVLLRMHVFLIRCQVYHGALFKYFWMPRLNRMRGSKLSTEYLLFGNITFVKISLDSVLPVFLRMKNQDWSILQVLGHVLLIDFQVSANDNIDRQVFPIHCRYTV